jgi:hypothetical protein
MVISGRFRAVREQKDLSQGDIPIGPQEPPLILPSDSDAGFIYGHIPLTVDIRRTP